MPKLKSLEFHISKDFDSKCVNLNKLFPALEELELFHWNMSHGYEWEEFLPNSEPCPNVKSLILGLVILKLQPFDHILNTFPKLTKLDLDVGSDGVQILRKIILEMTQLEDLSVGGTIEGTESIDALLTGIPVYKLDKLEHLVTELKEMTVQLRAESIRHYRARYCHCPSIANLTNLKRLHLSTSGEEEDEETYETHMTDIFAYFCLYSMKHIKKLEIENCEFTKAACEILTTEMKLNAWCLMDRDDCEIIPHIE